ncbi:MAG: protein kinase [Tabrizicola sp.]|jgi:serine/threonine-protein kinase|nr:protein kinase [Tabrizicola sp.]
MTGDDDSPPGTDGPDEERTRLILSQTAATTPPATSMQATIPPAPPPKPKAKSATVAIGTLINNNYIVREVLKSGGMGEVYRGENVFTHDPVAIKVVLQELAEDAKVGQMFLREARTLSQLSDEAIVRYYNFVKDPAIDRYCLVMEFIEGVTLADYTQRNGGLPREAAQALMRRLARGLDKAHARSVIHRDLSPDNVMLPNGVVADALLIDFGIAKSNVLQESTMAGQFAGKFKYVSPEQLGHFGGEIGPQTDIYGLALLMAAAIRGRPLDMGSSIVEAVDARRAIPDLSSLPEAFRPILSWMLEPDPANRVASMAEVVRYLDRPGDIPAKYRAGLSQSLPPVSLSLPPGQSGGLALPPGVAGRSTTYPPAQPELTARTPAAPTGAEEDSSRGPLLLLFGVFILVLGGALGFAWTQGFFDPAPVLPDPVASTEPAEQTTGPATFLAAMDLGACTLATVVTTEADGPHVHVFSTREDAFAGVAIDYQRQFGVSPRVTTHAVTDDQCPALEFARSFQADAGVQLLMTGTTIESGAPIEGRVTPPEGSALWLALISPRGGVYKLNQSLSGEIAGEQSFSFGLNLADGSPAAPQLLLAVATPTPLANAAAARDGADAKALFPLVAEEMAKVGGSVSVGQVMLVPKPAAPAPPGP